MKLLIVFAQSNVDSSFELDLLSFFSFFLVSCSLMGVLGDQTPRTDGNLVGNYFLLFVLVCVIVVFVCYLNLTNLTTLLILYLQIINGVHAIDKLQSLYY